MSDDPPNMTLLLDVMTQLGEVNRTLGGLLSSVTHLTDSASRMDAHAIADRQAIGITIDAIGKDIGVVQTQLAVGSQRHAEFARSIADIDLRTESIESELTKIPPIAIAVADMAPKVEGLMAFKGRMAAVVLVAGVITGGAITLIFEGIKFFTPDLHRLYERFH